MAIRNANMRLRVGKFALRRAIKCSCGCSGELIAPKHASIAACCRILGGNNRAMLTTGATRWMIMDKISFGPIWVSCCGRLGPSGGHMKVIWAHLDVTWAIWVSSGDDMGSSWARPRQPVGPRRHPAVRPALPGGSPGGSRRFARRFPAVCPAVRQFSEIVKN